MVGTQFRVLIVELVAEGVCELSAEEFNADASRGRGQWRILVKTASLGRFCGFRTGAK